MDHRKWSVTFKDVCGGDMMVLVVVLWGIEQLWVFSFLFVWSVSQGFYAHENPREVVEFQARLDIPKVEQKSWKSFANDRKIDESN